ncbi:MAG TPA: hypothetical protein VEK76_09090 [Candidatus Binatia bacterium]|nr:hypothetical protein [Candidatus Binatia bacterium]
MSSLPRQLLALPTIAAAAALAVACGPAAALTGDDPSQAVTTALQKAATTPLVMALSGSLSLDTSSLQNLPASIQSALTGLGSGGSATGTLKQESSTRRQLTASAGGHTLSAVEYDGHAYVSLDGGGYAELSTSLPASPAATGSQLGTLVGDLNLQDQGTITDNGASEEHYHAAITGDLLGKLAQDLAGGSASASQAGQYLGMLTPFITVKSGSVDIWLSRGDGSLVRASVSASLSVDVGSLASLIGGLASPGSGSTALPSGTLGITLSLDARVSNYGGAVTITKPVATGTMPMSPWSELFPSGPMHGFMGFSTLPAV